MKIARALGLGVALSAIVPARASAQTPLDVSFRWDGMITGVAVAGGALAALIPVDNPALWQRQLLPIDRRLEGRMSQTASQVSDVLLAVDVVTPYGLLIGQGGGLNQLNSRRLLVYEESVAINFLVTSVTKHLVGRPRPYAYSTDPRVRRYTDEEGKDAHLSFFSSHASTAFAASVTGSYLYAQLAPDAKTRAAVWGFELVLAGATADLGTRAGKHFYSDAIVGAIVGAGVGFLVPWLHGGPAYGPSAVEWTVIAAAPIAGVAIGELLPAKPSTLEPLTPIALPFITPGGGGILLAQAF